MRSARRVRRGLTTGRAERKGDRVVEARRKRRRQRASCVEVGIRLPARVCGEREIAEGWCCWVFAESRAEQGRAGQGVDAVGSVRSSSAVQLDY